MERTCWEIKNDSSALILTLAGESLLKASTSGGIRHGRRDDHDGEGIRLGYGQEGAR